MRQRILMLLSLVLFVAGNVLAQDLRVKGKVLDENGEPFIGATVRAKSDPTKGTLTNADGNFTITVKSGETLIISYVGYHTQEIKAAANLNIQLRPDSELLDEVVAVAYGTASKGSFTGSVSSVKPDQLTASKTESIDKALAGKLSGVQVSSRTGDPGAAGQVQIRGIGSITGSTQPLYIIDGIPMTTGKYGFESDGGANMSSDILSTLNPEDVESMTVLKDAAAASLYGSRAANGVIVITTKKGRMGKPQFNFKSTFGWSGLATKTHEVMNAQEYLDYYYDGVVGTYLYENEALIPGSKNYGKAGMLEAARKYADETYLTDDWSPVKSTKDVTNWRDYVYPGGNQQDYQLSLNGGTERLRYFASLGYSDINGVVRNSNFKRYSSLLNLNSTVNDWLDLSFKSQASQTIQTGAGDKSNQTGAIPTKSPLSLYLSGIPSEPIHNPDGSYNTSASLMPNVGNPAMAMDSEMSFIKNKVTRLTNDVGAKVTFTDWLNFTSNNSVDWFVTQGMNYWNPLSVDGKSVGGLGERNNYTVTTFTTSNFLSANKTLDDVHNLSGTLGHEYQYYEEAHEFFSADQYSNSVLKELENGQGKQALSSHLSSEMLSFFGNLNYNYDNRYYLGASLRTDISSKLGKNKRQGVFYSVSGSWRFGQEEFLKDNGILTDGKIRASYGTNGNLPNGAFDHLGVFYMGGNYKDMSASYIDRLENTDLGWESSKNLNVGLDLTFLNRFTIGVEYYNKYTSDLLFEIPVSWFTGVEHQMKNVGEICNQGWELEAHARNVLNSGEFNWDIDFTFATLDARVKKLPDGDVITGHGDFYIFREGEEMYTFYLPTYYGVDPESGLAQFLKDPTKEATPDNLTFKHSEAKKTLQGRGYANINGGLTNTFSWKGITLSALITYQFGGQYFDYAGYFIRNDGLRFYNFMPAKDLVGNYWKQKGDKVLYPRPVEHWQFTGEHRSDKFSTRTLFSSDFIRLKELSLSYQLPTNWIKSVGLTSASVSLTGTNLVYLYAGTPGQDLEVALNGYRGTDSPQARTVLFGLNFGF